MELEDMVKNIDDICGTVLQTASSETSPEIWHMIATLFPTEIPGKNSK